MRVGIIGCGLIGHKRAAAAGDHTLAMCADPVAARAETLAAEHPGCVATSDPARVISCANVDAVIVATTHDALTKWTLTAMEAGKHVLVEKPAARTAVELQPVVAAARARGTVVKVGFNHRFHPALQQARSLFASGAVGDLLYIRGRYGHGGRPGYEKEWRADPRISGGGELLDQGSHLIDLARWFAGDFAEATGHLTSYYWSMPVEDNAFVSLKTASGQLAWLHASWTEWKNLFSFEIVGRSGKLQVDGLGGSYGTERLTLYHMLPEMGPPETTSWEFPGADLSWHSEFDHFVDCIENGSTPCGSIADALANLEIVDCLYREAGRDHRA
ncbi:MAG: Gfo/Idh/MocA family oxidoreductase [Chloroflexota bacterium]|nr:Gfo/Idh/MocA family oxidoreductase [Chloroflexota bacterium]